MAWNGTKTWAATDTLTAADLNTYLRDNTDAVAQPFACSLTRTASIPDGGAPTTIDFTSAAYERYDPNNAHSLTTNPTRITIPTGWAGKLACNFVGQWTSPATAGRRLIAIVKNGTTTIARDDGASTSGGESTQSAFGNAICAAGDYLEITAYQVSNGNNLDLALLEFTVTWRRT